MKNHPYKDLMQEITPSESLLRQTLGKMHAAASCGKTSRCQRMWPLAACMAALCLGLVLIPGSPISYSAARGEPSYEQSCASGSSCSGQPQADRPLAGGETLPKRGVTLVFYEGAVYAAGEPLAMTAPPASEQKEVSAPETTSSPEEDDYSNQSLISLNGQNYAAFYICDQLFEWEGQTYKISDLSLKRHKLPENAALVGQTQDGNRLYVIPDESDQGLILQWSDRLYLTATPVSTVASSNAENSSQATERSDT